MNKNILYFVVIVILIIIFFLAGNNIMKLHDKVSRNEEVISNLNQKLSDNKIIIKRLTNKNNNLSNNEIHSELHNSSNGIGVMKDPNLKNKIKNHMNYPHGNPMMYDKPIRELYNDLK